ncbi:MAG: hypothetical protein LBT43_06465 [Prevotella sp.]|jgi:hypothetical protein|nr:hypothetical protein [Prevotella sp.]
MKKIVNRLITVTMLAVLAGLFACNEDLGNYDYKAINAVDSINNVENVYDVSLGDILKITPRLVFSRGEDENLFSFKWYYKSDGVWNLLQEGRNFEQEIAPPIGNNRSMVFEIINKETGIPYRKFFSIRVTAHLAKGYIALCESEDGFDIDMVAYSPNTKKFGLYKNILEASESTLPRQGVKPVDILTFTDETAPHPFKTDGTKYSVYILTDRYTTRVKSDDFSWSPDYDISNSIEATQYLDTEYKQRGKPVIATKMVVADSQGRRTWMYHVNEKGEGNWFLTQIWPLWRFFAVRLNVDGKGADAPRYEPASYISSQSIQGGLFYDKDNHRFMTVVLPPSSGGNTSFINYYYTNPLPIEPDGGAFKYSDPSYEDLLYMGERQCGNNVQYGIAIMKQKDNSYKYLEFNLTGSSGVNSTQLVQPGNRLRASRFATGSRIGDMKFIAAYPDYPGNPFLYYVTKDNKVYRADVSAGNAIEEDVTSTFIKDGYDEITQFEFLLPKTYNSSDCPASMKNGLAVATYKASLGKGQGGKLEIFLLKEGSSSGELELAKYPTDKELAESPREDGYQVTMSWEGMGRIVGLDYKQK